jgi:hypothetical protein
MSLERDSALQRARQAITDLASASCDCPYETERELADELDKADEALTDAGIPRMDGKGHPIDLAVRVRLLVDESNSVRAELNDLIDTLAL